MQGWYATLLKDTVLPHVAEWSYVITFGELACGLGVFTGIAAFGTAFMNMNCMLAGAASINLILLFLELLLILAWRVAGYMGVDFALLPIVGTPWKRGPLQERGSPPTTAPAL